MRVTLWLPPPITRLMPVKPPAPPAASAPFVTACTWTSPAVRPLVSVISGMSAWPRPTNFTSKLDGEGEITCTRPSPKKSSSAAWMFAVVTALLASTAMASVVSTLAMVSLNVPTAPVVTMRCSSSAAVAVDVVRLTPVATFAATSTTAAVAPL
jgi:hypothetical protein